MSKPLRLKEQADFVDSRKAIKELVIDHALQIYPDCKVQMLSFSVMLTISGLTTKIGVMVYSDYLAIYSNRTWSKLPLADPDVLDKFKEILRKHK